VNFWFQHVTTWVWIIESLSKMNLFPKMSQDLDTSSYSVKWNVAGADVYIKKNQELSLLWK
jgi:hypothetical protein